MDRDPIGLDIVSRQVGSSTSKKRGGFGAEDSCWWDSRLHRALKTETMIYKASATCKAWRWDEDSY